MNFRTNKLEFLNDFLDEIKLFYPADILEKNDGLEICHEISECNNQIINSCKIVFEGKEKCFDRADDIFAYHSELEKKKHLKTISKLCIYDALSSFTGKKMPWGALTGIRPTKVAYDLLNAGTEDFLLKETLIKDYRLMEDKASLVCKTIKNQNCIIKNDNLIDIYIHIPFCPTRCTYCSFPSAELKTVEKDLDNYVDNLIKEIKAMKDVIFEKTLIVRTIYIGGGTPTILSASQLDRLLSELSYPVSEFTVESGRPDTITEEKLDVFKKYGVTRICINPQTFNEKTLKVIGRAHTTVDVINAYKIALKYDFIINMDLIAGLPGEKFSHFKKSIDTCLELGPANITVHTLAIKNGSFLKDNFNMEEGEKEIFKMLDYAQKKLLDNGYQPYYLYRQKSMLSNLENIGWTQKGAACMFNIDSMEECCSILACGAGAISKRIFNLENRIERSQNVRFLKDYIERIDEMIERKKVLFV